MIFKECNKPGCKHYYEGACVGFVTHKEFTCPFDRLESIDISNHERTAIDALRNNCVSEDIEDNHLTADRFLCGFLEELGYKHITEIYDMIEKWYT